MSEAVEGQVERPTTIGDILGEIATQQYDGLVVLGVKNGQIRVSMINASIQLLATGASHLAAKASDAYVQQMSQALAAEAAKKVDAKPARRTKPRRG